MTRLATTDEYLAGLGVFELGCTGDVIPFDQTDGTVAERVEWKTADGETVECWIERHAGGDGDFALIGAKPETE